MRFVEFTLKKGYFRKRVIFSEKATEIYSKKNSAGKTTFLRAIYYALGYPIPNTKGIDFSRMEFWLTVENEGKEYIIYRHNSYISIEENGQQKDYSLPTDFHDIMTMLTGSTNKDVLDNLIGASYLDQEKGWTLLNRGKVIGSISFNIESLIRGLGGKDCSEEILLLEEVKRQLKKYEYMYSVAEYQEAIRESGEDIEIDDLDDIATRKIELLKIEKEAISDELKQIKDILRKNKLLADYISDMKLIVQTSSGEEIPVTRNTLVGFVDNNEFLTTRRELLVAELGEINKKIAVYQNRLSAEETLFKVQTAIEEFDSDIKKISVNVLSTQRIINNLKKERKRLQERIHAVTREDNSAILALHECISKYARELEVDEEHVSPNKDYIFTNDLKSLSGAILHKIVFSFRLAYIKLIKERTGIILPIVLDSPTGREVERDTVEKMLGIIQRDYSEHQLIIASIYDYKLNNKRIVEFKDRIFSNTDIINDEQRDDA